MTMASQCTGNLRVTRVVDHASRVEADLVRRGGAATLVVRRTVVLRRTDPLYSDVTAWLDRHGPVRLVNRFTEEDRSMIFYEAEVEVFEVSNPPVIVS